MSEGTWVKFSYSGSQANCVEVATRGGVLVRDTKDRGGAALRFTPGRVAPVRGPGEGGQAGDLAQGRRAA